MALLAILINDRNLETINNATLYFVHGSLAFLAILSVLRIIVGDVETFMKTVGDVLKKGKKKPEE